MSSVYGGLGSLPPTMGLADLVKRAPQAAPPIWGGSAPPANASGAFTAPPMGGPNATGGAPTAIGGQMTANGGHSAPTMPALPPAPAPARQHSQAPYAAPPAATIAQPTQQHAPMPQMPMPAAPPTALGVVGTPTPPIYGGPQPSPAPNVAGAPQPFYGGATQAVPQNGMRLRSVLSRRKPGLY